MGDRRLVVAKEVDCANCDGSGRWVDGSDCQDCEGAGSVMSYVKPLPSDLLTDPRVRAAVEELEWVFSCGRIQRASRRESIASALKPFKETS